MHELISRTVEYFYLKKERRFKKLYGFYYNINIGGNITNICQEWGCLLDFGLFFVNFMVF